MRHDILADNFALLFCVYHVMVKDKRMIIIFAIISFDQPLFTLYFSVWEISRGFYSSFHSLSLSLSPLYPFHLSIPFTSLSLSLSLSLSISLSLSYLSLPLYISPSTFLSLSLLLSLFSLSFSLAYLMDVFVLVFNYV